MYSLYWLVLGVKWDDRLPAQASCNTRNKCLIPNFRGEQSMQEIRLMVAWFGQLQLEVPATRTTLAIPLEFG